VLLNVSISPSIVPLRKYDLRNMRKTECVVMRIREMDRGMWRYRDMREIETKRGREIERQRDRERQRAGGWCQMARERGKERERNR